MLLLGDILLALYYPGGKLTLSQWPKACEEESEAQAQLTNIELPSQETLSDTLSTGSVDSGVGNSSRNSSSKLYQQDEQIEQSISELKELLVEAMDDLASPMDPLEQQRKRHYSDSNMTRYRKSEIRKKLGSVQPKALSDVSTQVEILEKHMIL